MPRIKYHIVLPVLLCVGLGVPAEAECWGWRQIAPPCSIDMDGLPFLVYDGSHQNLVLLMRNSNPTRESLWRFDGKTWHKEWEGSITSYLSSVLGLYYDDQSNALMAIGFRYWAFEQGSIGAFRYTQGSGWTTVAEDPSITLSNPNPQVVYDTVRKRAIILTVSWDYSSTIMTAEFDGTTFTYVEHPADIELSMGAVGYDPGIQRVVFIGINLEFDKSIGTYEYDGSIWQLIETSIVPPQTYKAILCGMAYMNYFEGLIGVLSDFDLSETWLYKDRSWRKIATFSQPSPRRGAEMAFDAGIGAAIILGGYISTDFCETWKFFSTKHCRPVQKP